MHFRWALHTRHPLRFEQNSVYHWTFRFGIYYRLENFVFSLSRKKSVHQTNRVFCKLILELFLPRIYFNCYAGHRNETGVSLCRWFFLRRLKPNTEKPNGLKSFVNVQSSKLTLKWIPNIYLFFSSKRKEKPTDNVIMSANPTNTWTTTLRLFQILNNVEEVEFSMYYVMS